MDREEALNNLKKILGFSPTYDEAFYTLFPQLKGSEDERIRKELVNFLQSPFIKENLTDEKVAPWIAYLEKQKDLAAIPDELVKNYKLFCENGRREVAVLINAINGINEQKEQKPVMIQWTGKNLKEVIDFTGKSPKFGKWFKSWDEFEEYVHSHDDILKLFCEDGSHYEVPVGAWIVKTPDGYNIPSHFRFVQKPAEWSEEDEKMLVAISKALGCDTAEKTLVNEGVTLVMAAGFLESLRPHWKPSEELEEEIGLWISENENIHHGDKLMVGLLKDIARYFAEWQKKQMLKEAVPFYEILEAVPPGPERENVRIIIVKED